MPDYDPIRLAKLLELAAHPSSNPGEALNSLRAASVLLARAGVSLAELAGARPTPQGGGEADEARRLQAEVSRLTCEVDRLRTDNARLRKANGRLERWRADLQATRGDDPPWTEAAEHAPGIAPRPKGRITAEVLAVYDLLAEWRSIADLAEKLGPGVSQTGVKRIVRLLDDQGLLRLVESWPTRYRLRFEGELSDAAKAFRSRIEDARRPDEG